MSSVYMSVYVHEPVIFYHGSGSIDKHVYLNVLSYVDFDNIVNNTIDNDADVDLPDLANDVVWNHYDFIDDTYTGHLVSINDTKCP